MPKFVLQPVPEDPRERRLMEIDEERLSAAIDRDQGSYAPPTSGLWASPGPLACVDLDGPEMPITWLVEGLVARESLVIVGGPPGGGKTWFAMALARALALGQPFLGHEVQDLNRVLYLDFENGEVLLRHRFTRLGIPRPFQQALHIVSLHDKITNPACWKRIMQEVEVYLPDVVFIDTLACAASLDENDVRSVEGFYEQVWEPLRARGVTLIFLHHTRKRGQWAEKAIDRFRGSMHLVGRVDGAMIIDPASGGGMTLSDAKARMRAELPPKHLALVPSPSRPGGLALEVRLPVAAVPKATKPNRKGAILALLASQGPMSASALALASNVSTSAVNVHLRTMVASGTLSKQGTAYSVP